MKKFTTVKSHSIPLPQKDIDTDMIIPAQYLTSTGVGGYGLHLFSRLKESDPHFPLNKAEYEDGQIMISGSNFGCGSSREHAVWALVEAGVKVIIASSFSDIFFNNAAKNGLLLIKLPENEVQKLLAFAAKQALHLEINLEEQLIKHEQLGEWEFNYDPFHKHCLINGQDQLDYLYGQMRVIDEFNGVK